LNTEGHIPYTVDVEGIEYPPAFADRSIWKPGNMIWAYGRASVTDEANSPHIQYAYTKALADKIPDKTWGGFLLDWSISAYKTPLKKRKHGRLIFEVVQPGDCLIIHRYDRAWRSLIDYAKFIEWCLTADINVYVAADGNGKAFDLNNPSDKLMASMQVAFAQFSSELFGDRVVETNVIRRNAGQAFPKIGRFGWRAILEPHQQSGKKWHVKEMVPDEAERNIIRLIWKMAHTKGLQTGKNVHTWHMLQGVNRSTGKPWAGVRPSAPKEYHEAAARGEVIPTKWRNMNSISDAIQFYRVMLERNGGNENWDDAWHTTGDAKNHKARDKRRARQARYGVEVDK
jgi:DNA invertase Pin-like site-specific DNA recombinase